MKRCLLKIWVLTLAIFVFTGSLAAMAEPIKSIALLPVNFNDKYLLNNEQDFVGSSLRDIMAEKLKARGYDVVIPAEPTGPRLHKADTTALAGQDYGTDAVMVIDINYIVDERIHPAPRFPTIYSEMYLHGETRVYRTAESTPFYKRDAIGSGRTESRVTLYPSFEEATFAQKDLSKKLLKGFAVN